MASWAFRAASRIDIRAIFNAPYRDDAEHLLDKFLLRYETVAPALVRWAETAIPKGFTVFALPASHRLRLRTTNVVALSTPVESGESSQVPDGGDIPE